MPIPCEECAHLKAVVFKGHELHLPVEVIRYVTRCGPHLVEYVNLITLWDPGREAVLPGEEGVLTLMKTSMNGETQTIHLSVVLKNKILRLRNGQPEEFIFRFKVI